MTNEKEKPEAQAASLTAPEPRVPVFQGLDPTILFVNPQRAAEAWIAAVQTLMQGMQDVSERHLMLQSTLLQQALTNAASILQVSSPGNSVEQATRTIQAATEATLQSMRDTTAAACKCQMDALTVYRDRLAGSVDAAAPACGQPEVARAAAE